MNKSYKMKKKAHHIRKVDVWNGYGALKTEQEREKKKERERDKE